MNSQNVTSGFPLRYNLCPGLGKQISNGSHPRGGCRAVTNCCGCTSTYAPNSDRCPSNLETQHFARDSPLW